MQAHLPSLMAVQSHLALLLRAYHRVCMIIYLMVVGYRRAANSEMIGDA